MNLSNALKLTLLLVQVCILNNSSFAAERPNVIFMMADDLGYGDVQANNPQSRIPTPNLDRVAQEGMRFTDAHSPSAVCTPTRYGVVTGRYSWRGALKRGVLNGYGASLIEPNRPTVATLAKSAGLDAAVIGKWHLGLDFQRNEANEINFEAPLVRGPTHYDFDRFFGIPASLDFPPYIYMKDDQIIEPATARQEKIDFPKFVREGERQPGFDPETCLDRLTQEAVTYIEARAHANDPFFLYFPLTAPHKPVWPAERFRGSTELGPYGDFVAQTDWVVGQILGVLDRFDLAENTLFLFTSDNGSFMYRRDNDEEGHVTDETIQAFREGEHRANGPLRGTKADIWEAGHRVPFLVRWPARVKAGSTSDQTICHVDLAATVADVLNIELPEDAFEDSFSFLPDLLAQERDRPRAPVIHHSASGMFAIRKGKWKLVAGNGSGGRERPRGQPFEKPYFLADIKADLAETQNLAEDRPEIVNDLASELKTLRDSGRSRP